MRLASLIAAVLLMILAGIGVVVCLLLPTITSGHASFEESLLGLIPSIIVFLLAFLWTVIAAIFFFKAKKSKSVNVAS